MSWRIKYLMPALLLVFVISAFQSGVYSIKEGPPYFILISIVLMTISLASGAYLMALFHDQVKEAWRQNKALIEESLRTSVSPDLPNHDDWGDGQDCGALRFSAFQADERAKKKRGGH